MAVFTYDTADLETLASGVLFGPREYRLLGMNTFRVINEESSVDYLVNAQKYTQEDVDTAVSNLSDAASAASSDLDTDDLQVVFTEALTSHRGFRLDLVNIFRAAQSDDDVDYLVNAYKPTDGDINTAVANIESDSE